MLRTLLKIRLRSYFASLFKGSRNKTRGPGFKIFMGLLAVYVIACLFLVFGTMFSSLCEPLVEADLGWLYFAMTAILSVALAFIGGVFTAQSQLYEARDNDLLLSMPIRPRTILASRMAILLITEYVFELFIAIPAGVVYTMHYPVSAAGVIVYIICCLFAPLIAVAVSCVVGWLVALIASRLPNKSLVSTVFSLVFLAVYFVVYFNAQKYIQAIIIHGTEAAEAVRRALYIFYCFGDAVAHRNLLSFAIFILFCAALFAVVYIILSRSFIRITTMKKSAAKRRSRAVSAGAMTQSGVRQALVRKELRRFFGSSGYLINAGLGAMLAVAGAVVLVIKHDAVTAVFSQLPGFEPLLPLFACAASCLLFSMVTISAPMLSLEGKCLWISQSIPVPAGSVLLAKADAHIIVALPCSLILSAVCAGYYATSFLSAIMIFLVPAFFVALTALLGVAINLRFPNFDWINETVCVKQSAAVIVAMLAGWGIVIAVGALYLFLSQFISPPLYMTIVAVIFAALSLLIRRSLKRRGARKFLQL